ncbi:MAG: putative toxin-antitoxin system toxin component, PIN family [Bacteroidetes bacterium]|nr:putative toxin-antitoxin system toxin component, PIN family [Bacteroidota bacterium]
MKKIVFDTNITISAFFWKGNPRTIYNLVKEEKLILQFSQSIENEYMRVLYYPKFGFSPSEIVPRIN